MSGCTVDNCGRHVIAKNMCSMHYERARRNGSPTTLYNAPSGSGAIRKDGYKAFKINGVEKLEHRLIAEKAIGHELPAGAEIHHLDGNRGNSNTNNLVICPNRAYHRLLHQRTDALEACGIANWLKCVYCKQYDDPSVMTSYTNKNGCKNNYHAQCKRDSAKAAHRAKKERNNENRI